MPIADIRSDTMNPVLDLAPWPHADAYLPPPDLGPHPEECTIGIRVDNCCTIAEPMTRAQLAADPCLVSFPPTFPILPECAAQWDPECDYIDCTFGPPPSRLAQKVQGECRFVHECQEADDCAIAHDFFRCCSCFEAYPRSLMKDEPCLIEPPQSWVPEHCFNPDCSMVDCPPCPSIPEATECLVMDYEGGFNRCEAIHTR